MIRHLSLLFVWRSQGYPRSRGTRSGKETWNDEVCSVRHIRLGRIDAGREMDC